MESESLRALVNCIYFAFFLNTMVFFFPLQNSNISSDLSIKENLANIHTNFRICPPFALMAVYISNGTDSTKPEDLRSVKEMSIRFTSRFKAK